MLLTYLCFQAVFYTTALKRHFARKREDLLLFGVAQPSSIPILDNKLDSKAGHLTARQSWKARQVTGLCRKLVNTKAFEHLVRGWANPQSDLHTGIARVNKLRRQAGLGL